MHILVTGGAGYIGTHVLIELASAGHSAVVADMLSNSSKEALRRTEEISGTKFPLYTIDLTDKDALRQVFAENNFDAVIHLAGHKAVGESVEKPIKYYRNNIDSTLALCELMLEYRVPHLVFSSSATVYGEPSELPLKETSTVGLNLTNPYGKTKFMLEEITRDIAAAHPEFSVTILRYFNPVGAHESGRIGENPKGIPNNIMPYISQVAVGKREKLNIFGGDYDTVDGTGVRDYIHVVDLARGHVAALAHPPTDGATAYNLSTGKGTSVLELVHAFEAATGKTIPYEIVARRPGDIAACYADATKAARELGWHTEKSVEDACRHTWNWQSQNPNGYV